MGKNIDRLMKEQGFYKKSKGVYWRHNWLEMEAPCVVGIVVKDIEKEIKEGLEVAMLEYNAEVTGDMIKIQAR